MRLFPEHWLLIGFSLALNILLVVFLPVFEPGQFSDPDAYMRLVRTAEFIETLEVRDHVIERSNAPYGEELHWSRPLDLILAVDSWPFRIFMGNRDGLAFYAYWVSPLILCLLLAVLASALTARWDRHFAFFYCLLMFCQPAVLGYFPPGRPDHHSLLVLLFGATVGIMLSSMRHRVLWAGLLCGSAAWVSVEAIVYVLPLYLGWSWRWWDRDLGAAGEAVSFGAAWLTVASIAVVWETPEQLFHPTMVDRLSGFHLLAMTLCVLAWMTLRALPSAWQTNRWNRFGLLGMVGALSAGVLYRMAPELLGGPYAHVDPELTRVWLKHVNEVQPLISDRPQALPRLLIWLFPMLVSLPWLGLCLYRRGWPQDRLTQLWGITTLVMTLLCFYQIRWVVYAQILWLFPFVLLLNRLLDYWKQTLTGRSRSLAVIVSVFAFAGGNVPLALLLEPSPSPLGPATETTLKTPPQGSAFELARFLNAQAPHTPRRIVARLGLGPELLYRTHHEVIATPYHRNAEGVLYVRTLMQSASHDDARTQLLERGVDWVLLEPDSSEAGFYRREDEEPGWYQMLRLGVLPPWLDRIPLPDSLNRYELFEVRLRAAPLPGAVGQRPQYHGTPPTGAPAPPVHSTENPHPAPRASPVTAHARK